MATQDDDFDPAAESIAATWISILGIPEETQITRQQIIMCINAANIVFERYRKVIGELDAAMKDRLDDQGRIKG